MPSAQMIAESRLRSRRAVGLIGMSAILPGSAQVVLGNRRAGVWAMRIWGVVVALVLLTGLALLLWRGPTVGLLLRPAVAPVLKVLVWVLFIGWVALLLDAWRLSRPLTLPRNTRLVLTICCLTVVVAMGFATNFVARALTAVSNVSVVFGGGGDVEQKAGRYNILLLGVDAADGRDGLRPDSINVASVHAETGRTVIFGLPRNLQGAPFPEGSPLHDLHPDGYRCDDGTCMLNGIHTLGEENADLYPDQDAGLAAMTEVAEEILGLDINYYAMVDMAGFQSLINAMGGITLDINKRIPMGGGGSNVHGYIEPGEDVFLDGYHALWFARSRHDSSDYERMVRQKCVMGAMARQLDPGLVATRFVELSEAGKDILRTDVGGGHLAELAELALRAKDLDIVSVNFMPPLIVAADPDFDLIRSTVVDSIAASEAIDEAAPATTPATTTPTEAAEAPVAPEPGPADEPTAEVSSAPAGSTAAAESSPSATATAAEWICRVSQ